MIIRPAGSDDWPRIWPFFDAIVAAGETYAYPLGMSPDEGRALWMEQPPGRTVVAAVDGVVVGSAKMGPNRGGRGSHVATASFMVDPAARGLGVGRALGEHVVGWAADEGFRGIQLNAVVETNSAAVSLWQALGFRVVGTVPGAFDHPRHGPVGLHVMYRDLSPASAATDRATPPAHDPEPIRGVVLDFHATLVDTRDPAEWVENAWRHLRRPGSAAGALGPEAFSRLGAHLHDIWVHATTIDPQHRRDLDGARHRQVFADTMALLPGNDPELADALYAVMSEQSVAFDDTLPLLRGLRDRGVRVVVLSNVGFDIRGGVARAGMADLVDGLVLSYEVGAVKPQPEIFRRALDQLGLPAESVLMVGDSWRDDGAAAAVGMRTLILPRTTGPVHGLGLVLRMVDRRSDRDEGGGDSLP